MMKRTQLIIVLLVLLLVSLSTVVQASNYRRVWNGCRWVFVPVSVAYTPAASTNITYNLAIQYPPTAVQGNALVGYRGIAPSYAFSPSDVLLKAMELAKQSSSASERAGLQVSTLVQNAISGSIEIQKLQLQIAGIQKLASSYGNGAVMPPQGLNLPPTILRKCTSCHGPGGDKRNFFNLTESISCADHHKITGALIDPAKLAKMGITLEGDELGLLLQEFHTITRQEK